MGGMWAVGDLWEGCRLWEVATEGCTHEVVCCSD